MSSVRVGSKTYSACVASYMNCNKKMEMDNQLKFYSGSSVANHQLPHVKDEIIVNLVFDGLEG